MAKLACDRESSLVDLTEMSLGDLTGLDSALLNGSLGRLLNGSATGNRLWARSQCSVSEGRWQNYPADA